METAATALLTMSAGLWAGAIEFQSAIVASFARLHRTGVLLTVTTLALDIAVLVSIAARPASVL